MRRQLSALVLAQIDAGNQTLPGIAKALDMPPQSLTQTLANLRASGTLDRSGYRGGYTYHRPRKVPQVAARPVASIWAYALAA